MNEFYVALVFIFMAFTVWYLTDEPKIKYTIRTTIKRLRCILFHGGHLYKKTYTIAPRPKYRDYLCRVVVYKCSRCGKVKEI